MAPDGRMQLADGSASAKLYRLNAIDAHFGYPDGRAAALLGRWLSVPVMITLRGKEERQARTAVGIPRAKAIRTADRLVCVSGACASARSRQAHRQRKRLSSATVWTSKFHRTPQADARRDLNIPQNARVLISVGGLVERKGFHRVIACLPRLLAEFPDLHYVIVGGPGPEGDIPGSLRRQAAGLRLVDRVHFLGPVAPERLKVAYLRSICSSSPRATRDGRTCFWKQWRVVCPW